MYSNYNISLKICLTGLAVQTHCISYNSRRPKLQYKRSQGGVLYHKKVYFSTSRWPIPQKGHLYHKEVTHTTEKVACTTRRCPVLQGGDPYHKEVARTTRRWPVPQGGGSVPQWGGQYHKEVALTTKRWPAPQPAVPKRGDQHHNRPVPKRDGLEFK